MQDGVSLVKLCPGSPGRFPRLDQIRHTNGTKAQGVFLLYAPSPRRMSLPTVPLRSLNVLWRYMTCWTAEL